MTSVIACTLDVLDGTQRARQRECRRAIHAATQEIRGLSDGYVLHLGPDAGAFLTAAEWITLERRCCSFLNFKLEMNDHGDVWLWLTGPEDVKAFVGEAMRADWRESAQDRGQARNAPLDTLAAETLGPGPAGPAGAPALAN